MSGVLVIGEVGSNYNGDLDIAKRYVRACAAVGADAVKFQTLRRDRLATPSICHKITSLELPNDWHYELKGEADRVGIEFLSTPFYMEAVDLLEGVGVSTYKVSSGDITFFPLLMQIGQTGKRVLLSTGASSLQDVDRAIDTLVKAGAIEVIPLHCVSNYPPQWNEMNLRAIVTLKDKFGAAGLSDHSPGSLAPIAAVALGAVVIEKHITFDRSLSGPDHSFAMTVDEFGDMVRQIRLLERSLGDGKKMPTETELGKRYRMRRGTYTRVTFDPTDDLGGLWLRPESGVRL